MAKLGLGKKLDDFLKSHTSIAGWLLWHNCMIYVRQSAQSMRFFDSCYSLMKNKRIDDEVIWFSKW